VLLRYYNYHLQPLYRTTWVRLHSQLKINIAVFQDLRQPTITGHGVCGSDTTCIPATYHKFQLTPKDRTVHCVTPSRHRAVHKVGRWMWLTCNSRQSTVDNNWRRSMCRHEIILSSQVGEKLQRELCLFLIFKCHIRFINILQIQRGLSPKPEALDPAKAWPWLIDWKSHTLNDCMNLPPWNK